MAAKRARDWEPTAAAAPTKLSRIRKAGTARGLSREDLLRRMAVPKSPRFRAEAPGLAPAPPPSPPSPPRPPRPGGRGGEGGEGGAAGARPGASARNRGGIGAARLARAFDDEGDFDEDAGRCKLRKAFQLDVSGMHDVIELKAGGVHFKWDVCLPTKFLQKLVADPEGRWAKIVSECMHRRPCSRSTPWRLLLYRDDIGCEGPNASAPRACLKPGGGRFRYLPKALELVSNQITDGISFASTRAFSSTAVICSQKTLGSLSGSSAQKCGTQLERVRLPRPSFAGWCCLAATAAPT